MSSSRVPKSVNQALRALPILEGCSRKELATVDRHTTLFSFAAGRTLCREGEHGREAFIITSGEAEVAVGGVVVAHLGAGDVVGEMALIEKEPRTATVTAITPVSVLALSVADFVTVIHDVPTLSRRLLTTLSERLRGADRAMTAG